MDDVLIVIISHNKMAKKKKTNNTLNVFSISFANKFFFEYESF